MKIEIRNLKIAKTLSEETTAYTGVIYIDGKRAFDASNHGQGGCDNYRPIAPFKYDDIDRINTWLKANRTPMENPYGSPLEYDLELEVGDLITKFEIRKEFDRMVKKRLVVIGDKDGVPTLFTYKNAPTQANIDALNKRGEKVVNGNAEHYELALKAFAG